jgi:PAS domain S-box-containing protein
LILNLALTLTELIALGVIALILHWSSRRFGLAPLLMFVSGLVAFLHWGGALGVSYSVAGVEVAVYHTTIVPVLVMALLVLYEADGTAVARTTILGILGLSALLIGLQCMRNMHMMLPAGANRLALPADSPVFSSSVKTIFASTVAFLLSLVGVAVVHQWLRNRVRVLPSWFLPGPALLVALALGEVVFRVMALGRSDLFGTLPGGLPGEVIAALVLWPFAGFYLVRYAPRFATYGGRRPRPAMDVVFGTSRQREMELRETEKRHRETEERLQSVVAHAPLVVFSVDKEGLFTLSEGAGLEGLSLRPGQVVGSSAFELFPEAAPALREALEGRRVSTTVDTHGRFFEVEYTPMFEGDAVVGATGVATDISSRRDAELALTQSQLRFRSTFEHAPVGLVHADPRGRILLANPVICELLGYTHEEFEGEEALAFVHPGDRDSAARGMLRLLEGESDLFSTDQRYRCKNGDVVWARATASLVKNETDQPQYVIVVLEDLTERMATEEQLRHAKRLEAMGQLTGGVAHDFNNLLTVVMGGLEIALLERLSEKQREGLVEARNAVERGASLIHGLLAFSRRQALTPELLHAGYLLDGMRTLLVRTLGESVDVRITVQPDLRQCLVDRHQMESSILNLALNARDAMPRGGNLVLTAERIDVGQALAAAHDVAAGSYVRVSVADDGVGIPAADLDRVFEPFYTTKDVGKGSGLGLSMVYGFAQQSGGFVTIDSVPGAGAAVSMHLPAVEGVVAPEAGDPEGEDDPRGHGEGVLLVEDDAAVRRLLTKMLAGLGYRVHPVERGAEALSLLQEGGRIDVLLTDVMLPGGMHGTEVARRAQEISPDLCVIYCSGYSGRRLGQASGLSADVRLLEKPFRRSVLAEALAAALGRDG